MKLLTDELEYQLVEAYHSDPSGEGEQTVYAKFFYPMGAATWFCVAFDPIERMLFCWTTLGDPQNAEWGWVALSELEEFVGKFGMSIERDLYFKPQKVSECKELQRMMKGE